MISFDLYLFHPQGVSFPVGELRRAIRSQPNVHSDQTDPDRFVYHDRNTGVFFSILTGSAPAEADWRAEETEEPEAPEQEELSEEDATDNGEEGDDAEGEEAPPPEMPPLTVSVPLFCPSFFLHEALDFTSRLAGAAPLSLEVPGGQATREEQEEFTGQAGGDGAVLARWMEETRRVYAEQKPPPSVTLWSRAQAESWWRYGKSRIRLQEELAGDHVAVPLQQLARHQEEVKTLCTWDVGCPTVLPRPDLVLVRVERHRKGILLSRKVTVEGLVEGKRLWDLLAPFSEIRTDPVDLLIFREARKPPSQVAAELEVLRLESAEEARRAELLGVVDFDLKSS